MAEPRLHSSEEPPAPVRALLEQVRQHGGEALAAYREPVGGH